jgi:hypothetical protein
MSSLGVSRDGSASPKLPDFDANSIAPALRAGVDGPRLCRRA